MSTDLDPAELKQKFYSLRTFEDLASLLDVPKNKLYYYTYKSKKDHYKSFSIPKKTWGVRKIYAPSTPLKIIQH
ncbi:MAG TPA: hypothetical protein PKE23_10405, partial [Anaerolineales bacterium]|nr:hypothetical protein [Anaerolineales bacterium]